ncbi:MAG: glycosyltransferase family 4 protein [Bacteroidota bacterium]|nr:glycosyltransferase family 4 protein [Bacteroidota bacterium]
MKVAVYSGTIPSTTFVEHLVNGLGAKGVEILLFGKYTKQYIPSSPNIKVYASHINYKAIPFVAYNLAWLMLHDFDTFKKIPYILKVGNKSKIKEAILFLSLILPILIHKPDIFHIQWAKAIGEFKWIKEVLNPIIIVSLRGGQINYSPVADKMLAEKYRKYFPMVHHFHGVSEAIIKEAEQYGLDPSKATVIRPAVQKSLLDNPLKSIGRKEKLSILSVGRFHWKKGYHYALDAMKILKNSKIDFHFTIVAGGEHEEILFQIHSLDLEKQVTIVHGLPHAEVLNIMINTDLFLLPSVEEGIANVVLEAMALGTPVITTNCGGMEEVVKDQYNGFMVPVRNPEAIAEAIKHYNSLPIEKLDNMRENARTTITQNHLVENQVIDMIDLYKNLFQQKS